MATSFPFLTAADPAATSEGTLDPLGLYQISDQLAPGLCARFAAACWPLTAHSKDLINIVNMSNLADNPRKVNAIFNINDQVDRREVCIAF